MITVFARYRARAGRGDAVRDTLEAHLAATREEPGCLRFTAFRSSSDPDRFLLFEQYVDGAALDAHRASPHFHRYIEGVVVPLLEERQFDLYEEIEPGPA